MANSLKNWLFLPSLFLLFDFTQFYFENRWIETSFEVNFV